MSFWSKWMGRLGMAPIGWEGTNRLPRLKKGQWKQDIYGNPPSHIPIRSPSKKPVKRLVLATTHLSYIPLISAIPTILEKSIKIPIIKFMSEPYYMILVYHHHEMIKIIINWLGFLKLLFWPCTYILPLNIQRVSQIGPIRVVITARGPCSL